MNPYLDAVIRRFGEGERIFATMARGGRDETLRWRDLEKSSRAFLAAYRRAGVKPGGTVLIFLRHVPELYGSFFGAMLGGFVPSFMPCTSPRQSPAIYWPSHRALMERIAPGLVVADRATLVEMAANGLTPPRSLAIEDVTPADADWSIPPGGAIGLLQHSSGTTGLKKGVALSYDALAAQVNAYAASLGATRADTIASWLPLYHDMGLIACLVMPAMLGIPVVQLDPFDWVGRPELLFEAIARHRASLCWLPNFAFDHLAIVAGKRGPAFDLSSVRAFIDCSEPCKPASLDRFAKAFAVPPEKLQCCYAMAETVFAVTQTKLGKAPTRIRRGGVELIETGSPVAGVEISIHDETRAPVTEGIAGEIAIRCPFLFSGYNLEPERAAERLADGLYFTRDLGFVQDGKLYVLGRIDDLIIVSGRNLYAHEIEAIVSGIGGVKPGRAVALAVFDPRIGTQGLIVVAERDGSRPDTELRREIAETIFSVVAAMPHAVHLVEEGWLVKTTSGKISREANLKKLATLQ